MKLKLVVVAFVIFALVAGGWWYINYQTKIAAENTETAGWKTYRDEEYGFEFKYPAAVEYPRDDSGVDSPAVPKETLELEILQMTPKLANLVRGTAIGDISFNTNKVGFFGLSVRVQDWPENLNEFAESLAYPTGGPYRFITVDGERALRYQYGGLNEGEAVIIPIDNKNRLVIDNHWLFLEDSAFSDLIQSLQLRIP